MLLVASGACQGRAPAATAPASMTPTAATPKKNNLADVSKSEPAFDGARMRVALHAPPGQTAHLDVDFEMPLDFIDFDYRAVRVRFRDEKFRAGADGYGQFVQARGKDGRHAPLADPMPPPADKTVRLSYRVRLESHLADPVVGLDEVPHPVGSGGSGAATPKGWFLNGRAFVPTLHVVTAAGEEKEVDMDAELSLASPIGHDVISSVAPGKGPWRAPSASQLRNALYYSGKFTRSQAKWGNVRADIVSSDFGPSELESLRALTTKTLRVSQEWLGPLPEKRVLLVYDRAAERAGGVVGQGISLMYDVAPSAVASSPMGIVVVHELMHLYNRADSWWLNEGLTRYLELAMTLRLDGASIDEATRRLLELNEKYRASGASRSVAKATELEAYSAGALYCFCLDTDLRKRGASLAAVHRRARESAGEGALTEAGFFDAMTALAPEAVAAARRLLQAKGPVDLKPCLERAGYRVQRRTSRQLSTKALAVDVLNILGHDLDRAQVLRVPVGSRFRRGDVITSVNGSPVRDFDQIRWLVSSQPAGARLRLGLRRGNQELFEEVPLKPLPSSAYVVHESLKVTRTPATNSLLD
ncbi:MAG TPA: hypothetical protein PKA88_04255 [Polyangiaceae bacterium]|nr:hypothetical protein [Polyangiaceae bacterium]